MNTRGSLVVDLLKLGVRPGSMLCVHSSFKSLGAVEGGADTVLCALLDLLGENGTLLFPAFTFGLLHEPAPVFDYDNTPSCVGYLSERFRTAFATGRSIHLSHSYSACGKHAAELLTHPEDTTPCGIDTPLAKLLLSGGDLLLLGCGMNTLTAAHVVEEAAEVPYVKFKTIPNAQLRRNGETRPLASRVVEPFSYDFERLRLPLTESGALRSGNIGNAAATLIAGKPLFDITSRLLLADPFFLSTTPEQP